MLTIDIVSRKVGTGQDSVDDDPTGPTDMADPPTSPGTGDEHRAGADRTTATGAPRWVKVSALLGLAAAVVVVVLLLAGGGLGEHGPGRHVPGGDTTGVGGPDGHGPPPGVPDHR